MSDFDFKRGRQMIIHDSTLNNPYTNPPTSLRPPSAMNTWTVTSSDTAEHIIAWAAVVARGDSGEKKLDALHFMAHGSAGGVSIGGGKLGWNNYTLWKKLDGLIKGAIVFFSCKIGAEQSGHSSTYDLTFGNAVAKFANCKVLACKVNQLYGWNSKRVIDFGAFEDLVYLYTPSSEGAKLLNYSKKSKVDLEKIIFG